MSAAFPQWQPCVSQKLLHTMDDVMHIKLKELAVDCSAAKCPGRHLVKGDQAEKPQIGEGHLGDFFRKKTQAMSSYNDGWIDERTDGWMDT